MKVLIIENAKDDYKNLATRIADFDLIPACSDLRDDDQVNRTIEIFKSNNTRKLKKYITTIIKENYEELRVVICDLRLVETDPNYEGKDVIEWIRAVEIVNYPFFSKYIPIIIYTSYSDQERTKTALTAGGSCFVPKSENFFIKEVVNSQGKKFSEMCDNFILKKKYKVGLTFTGKNRAENIPHRAFIEEIANQLATEYSKSKVFYDMFHEPEMLGLNGKEKFTKVYEEECEWIIVFLSADYATANEWTGIEWKAIQNYAKKGNADKIILIKIEEYDETKDPILYLDKYAIHHSATDKLQAFNGAKLNQVKYENMKEMIANNTQKIIEIVTKRINANERIDF